MLGTTCLRWLFRDWRQIAKLLFFCLLRQFVQRFRHSLFAEFHIIILLCCLFFSFFFFYFWHLFNRVWKWRFAKLLFISIFSLSHFWLLRRKYDVPRWLIDSNVGFFWACKRVRSQGNWISLHPSRSICRTLHAQEIATELLGTRLWCLFWTIGPPRWSDGAVCKCTQYLEVRLIYYYLSILSASFTIYKLIKFDVSGVDLCLQGPKGALSARLRPFVDRNVHLFTPELNCYNVRIIWYS